MRLGIGILVVAAIAVTFAFALATSFLAVDADAQQTTPPAASAQGGPTPRETYLWRPVAIGGGGFISGLAFATAGETMVARTDVHGAYVWNATANRWTQLVTSATMPPAARTQAGMNEGAYDIAVAPGDARRLYLAIKGAVYRSDDGGKTWTAPATVATHWTLNPNGPFRLSGPHLAVAPGNPDLVLIGTQKDGLQRSADGGRTWSQIASVPAPSLMHSNEGSDNPGILAWFAPAGKGMRVYAASAGHGLFVSEDGGANFRPLPAAGGGGPAAATRLSVAPDGSLFVVDREAKQAWLYRDGRWSDLAAAGLPATGFSGIAANPKGGAVVATDQGGQIWCSGNGGKSWSYLSRDIRVGEGDPPWLRIPNASSYFSMGEIAFDPKVSGRLWFATGIGPYFADFGAGCPSQARLVSQVRGIEEIVANDVTQTPGHAPLFAGWDFGIHRKPDLDRFSDTYGPKPRMLIAAQQLATSVGDPDFVVTNASDTRIGCCAQDGDAVMAGFSTDGGISWRKFPTLPQPPGTKPDDPWRMAFGTIAVAADDTSDIVWEPAFDRSPFYTRDRGQSWTRIALPGETLPLTGSFENFYGARKTLAADRVLPHTFYLVHSGGGANAALAGLWRSTDGGAHWQRIHAGEIAPNSAASAKLRAVPGAAGHLFFTSGVNYGADRGLRRSEDGGATWTIVPGMTDVDDIAFGKAARGADAPTIFVSGQFAGRYGIWRSIDGGARWQSVGGFPLGSLDQVTVLAADPDVFGRVYVGYMGSGWAYGEPAPCRYNSSGPSAERDCVQVETMSILPK